MIEAKNLLVGMAVLVLLLVVGFTLMQPAPAEAVGVQCSEDAAQSVIMLPEPNYSGLTVEEAIGERRSIRSYTNEKITLEELSMLLWAGQGITSDWGARASPSAGALYPMELYVVPNRVEGAGCGIYHYVPQEHKLVLVREGDFGEEVFDAAHGQTCVRDAAVVIVMTAVRERTAVKYADAADTLIAMEAGHISENILLESVSLGLGSVPVGGFIPAEMDEILGVEEGESSLYAVAIGKI